MIMCIKVDALGFKGCMYKSKANNTQCSQSLSYLVKESYSHCGNNNALSENWVKPLIYCIYVNKVMDHLTL